jgi:hypothetical protein
MKFTHDNAGTDVQEGIESQSCMELMDWMENYSYNGNGRATHQ